MKFKWVSLLFFILPLLKPLSNFQGREGRKTISEYLCGSALLLSLCPAQHDHRTPELESPMEQMSSCCIRIHSLKSPVCILPGVEELGKVGGFQSHRADLSTQIRYLEASLTHPDTTHSPLILQILMTWTWWSQVLHTSSQQSSLQKDFVEREM